MLFYPLRNKIYHGTFVRWRQRNLFFNRSDTQFVENTSGGILTEPDDFGWVLTFIWKYNPGRQSFTKSQPFGAEIQGFRFWPLKMAEIIFCPFFLYGSPNQRG